jgi:hypothetical protein
VHQNWRQGSDQCKWYNSTLPNSMEERQGMLEHGVSDAKYKGAYTVFSDSYLHGFMDEAQNPRLVREQQGLLPVKVF